MGGWEEIRGRAPRTVTVDGVEVGRGSRVVLRPRAGGDIFDLALAGKVAVVEDVEQDVEGRLQLAVTLEDDPGRDLGTSRQPGHRFFFSLEEVEPLAEAGGRPVARARVLVAGIGNLFLGDDGFGVEVVRRLAGDEWPPGVEVRDFGIRGMDLAYALGEDYDAAILVDAVPRGKPPGTLYVIEPDVDLDEIGVDTHGMDPVKVLRLAHELGPVPGRLLLVGCEPQKLLGGEDDELLGELSEPVQAGVDGAAELVRSLVAEILSEENSNNAEVNRR